MHVQPLRGKPRAQTPPKGAAAVKSPEVARLEARVLRLADLLERASAGFSKQQYTHGTALAWRVLNLRGALYEAVNALREARRAGT